MSLKICHISDTHGIIPPDVEECDVLIHSGDLTNVGELHQLVSLFEWMRRQKARHIILVAGNHDRSLDRIFMRERGREDIYFAAKELIDGLPENIHYLENESVTIEGVNFWGSPVTPDFFPQFWAFNMPRGEIEKVWKEIPNNTDVIITHGPPELILDDTVDGVRTGCKQLAKRIEEIKPKLWCGGHIHEAYGIVEQDGVTYSNASLMDERYRMVNKPNIFEI